MKATSRRAAVTEAASAHPAELVAAHRTADAPVGDHLPMRDIYAQGAVLGSG